MKKYLVSFLAISVFVGYSIYKQSTKIVISTTPASQFIGDTNVLPSVVASDTPPPTSTATLQPARTSTPKPTATTKSVVVGMYKDGSYIGGVADAFYGNIQVKAIISGGKITDVQFLQYPNDRARSIEINSQAMPLLRQEAIQAQSANVNIVSRATDSSIAFVQSLKSALDQAKNI